MARDPFLDSLLEYALGQLSEEVRLRVKVHLDSGCAECVAELKQIEETLHMLPYALSTKDLNANLRTRLSAAVNAEIFDETEIEKGRHHISHYRILRQLGAGGMGEVYLAEDLKLGRTTALKVLRREAADDSERKKRFLREARAAAVLSHPGIATIYEVGRDANTDFIAMEYVEGRQLAEIIGGKPLEVSRVIKIGKQIAEALAEAHMRGILHRDLKPENIQVTASDHVKVLDFGLAKFMESRLEDDFMTSSERILGTIPYMSPEQVEGTGMDLRSDIFSLGSILYEMATGKAPFTGEHPAATLENILREDPPLISQLVPGVPVGLQKTIYKCLRKDPAQRYENASELASDLHTLQFAGTIDLERPFAEVSASAAIRIAVLYFENLSEEKESDYFRAGMTEDIITELSKVRSWEVRPRSQVVRYKDQAIDIMEAGRELRVTHFIHGSIRKAGSRLRISTQLVDAKNARSLWGERYDRQLEDVFDIQAEIAQKIATALQVHLTNAEKREIEKRPTRNLQAYDLYLRGREMIFKLSKDGVHSAIDYFLQAISSDSKYALAYAGLAQAYAINLSFYGGQESMADLAIANAYKALNLDPNLGQAYVALGLAYLLKRMSSEAIDSCNKAIEINPYDAFATWISGRLAYRLNLYEQAAERFLRTIELLPDFYTAYSDLCQAYQNMGMPDRAREMRKQTAEACRRYLDHFPAEARAQIFLATASAWLGRREDALEAGRKAHELSPDDPVMMYNLACLYSLLGDAETAIDWLEKSVQNGRRDFEWMKRDPALSSLQSHPRYQKLISS